MTVRISPTQGPGRALSSTRVLWPWKYASGDWIVPGGQNTYEGETVPSVRDPDLAGPLDQFGATWSSTSRTVTIGTGEMTLMGAYVGSDDTALQDSGGDVIHDVTLDASKAGQQVYIGYDHTETDENALIIDRTGYDDSDFTASTQPRQHIWTFDTDADGVTNASGAPRPLGKRIDIPNARLDSNLDGTVDAAEDASTLGGRSGDRLGRDTIFVPIPRGEIQDNDFWGYDMRCPTPPAHLVEQNHVNDSLNAPTGLDAVIYAGDGTELYRSNDEINRGSLDTPVDGPWDRVYLRLRVENATGGKQTTSGGFKLLFE